MTELYTKKALLTEQEKIVNKYSKTVSALARTIYNRINYMVPLEDLQQIGYTGLLEAVRRQSEKEQNASYYEMCIKGKILDELRKNDHLTQKDREMINAIEKEKNLLLNEQSSVSTVNIANKLKIDMHKYYELEAKNQIHKMMSLEELKENDTLKEDPFAGDFNLEDNYQKHQIKKLLSSAIKKLNYQEQVVLQLVYYEDCSFAEAAAVLEVSKSKVFSIHNNVIAKIRETLNVK